MKCGMVKGGVLGLGLAAATLFWVFGGRAWDLVQSKADKARESVRAAMTSFDDEVDMARKAVAKLTPAIKDGSEALAKLEDSVKESEATVKSQEKELASLGQKIEALRASLDGPAVHRVGGSAAQSGRRATNELLRLIDQYKQVDRTVTYERDTLTFRKAQVQTAFDRLSEMAAKQKTLLSKINEIEARHKARVAARQFNEFSDYSTPLTEAEHAVASLDKKENIPARADEIQKQLSGEAASPTSAEGQERDAIREADEILKTPTFGGTSTVDRDA